MISTDLLRVTTCLTSTHRRNPEILSSLVPLFAGVVAMTQRDLIVYLLNTEADWPWAKQPSRKWRNGSQPLKQCRLYYVSQEPCSRGLGWGSVFSGNNAVAPFNYVSIAYSSLSKAAEAALIWALSLQTKSQWFPKSVREDTNVAKKIHRCCEEAQQSNAWWTQCRLN